MNCKTSESRTPNAKMFVEVNNHHLLTLQQVMHHMLLLYSCTTFMVHTFPRNNVPIKRLETQSITLRFTKMEQRLSSFTSHYRIIVLQQLDDQEKPLSSPSSNDVTHNKISTHYTVLSNYSSLYMYANICT